MITYNNSTAPSSARSSDSASSAERKLAIIDIDGTLTSHRSIWQYLMEQTGTWEDVGQCNLNDFLARRIDYQEFCHRDAKLFRGMQYEYLRLLAHEVPKPRGLDGFFKALQDQDFTVVLLSTGLCLLGSYFTGLYNIADCVANDLEVKSGICTGRSIVNVNEFGKGEHAKQMIAKYQSDYVLAVGDSAGDLPVFDMANMSIAVNTSDERVLAAADASINGDDMSVIGGIIR